MKTIRLSGRNYELSATNGKILNAAKNMETKVSGSGGGGRSFRGTGYTNRVRIDSTTIVHDHVFLEDDGGQEHSFQLKHFDLACREGNQVSVIAAVPENGKSGPYVGVINHTTNKVFYSEPAMKSISGPNKFLVIAAYLVIAFIGFGSAGSGFFAPAVILLLATFGYYIYSVKKDINAIKAAIVPAEYSFSIA